MLALRPMTDAEYLDYDRVMWDDYAQERARNMKAPIEEQRLAAAEQRASLLPDGQHTPAHYFWMVVDESGARVGQLWVHADESKKLAFIYSIDVDAAQRGKGYGKQTLELLDARMRSMGIARIALSVFGDNAIAMHLYQTMGYRTIATHMEKEL